MQTFIRKGFHGWTADTHVPLEDGYALHFCTMKRSNGAIVTTAQRVKTERSSSGFTGFSFVMFQDFNMRVLSESGRATEKFIADQHRRALAKLAEIKAACEAHYSKEAA